MLPVQLQRPARNLKYCMYHTFQRENNKGADQTASVHRLVCSFFSYTTRSEFQQNEIFAKSERTENVKPMMEHETLQHNDTRTTATGRTLATLLG